MLCLKLCAGESARLHSVGELFIRLVHRKTALVDWHCFDSDVKVQRYGNLLTVHSRDLTLLQGDVLEIAPEIKIHVNRIKGCTTVSLGIVAPLSIRVTRPSQQPTIAG